MVELCRQKCAGNEKDLQYIDEFEEYYNASNAIFWFTRDIFLYRLLNKALRELDIDTIYSLRYFFKDLHTKLLERYFSTRLKSASDSLRETVFRGQLMSNKEFDEKIRHNTGGFLPVSSFFSTTLNRQLAFTYAGDGSSETEQSIVFEIDVDKNDYIFPYADISTESAFDGVESEVLFTFGAVFRILSIEKNDDNIWIVKLKLTQEEDGESKALTLQLREQILCAQYPLQSLSNLMAYMGHHDKAEKYSLLLLRDTSFISLHVLSIIYEHLGSIYHYTGRHELALEYYWKSFSVLTEHQSVVDPTLQYAHKNKGHINEEKGDYKGALFDYTEALKIQLQKENLDFYEIANSFYRIGQVYRAQKYYEQALSMHEKSLAIKLNIFPPTHPKISLSYQSIGQIYYLQGLYAKALTFYEKCLEVAMKAFHKEHSNISLIYTDIGLTYYRQADYNDAADCFQKALQVQLTTSEQNQPILATTYENLAYSLYNIGKMKEGLEHMKKACEINSKNFPSNHPKVIRDFDWVADVQKELAGGEVQAN
ncbi:unnamed protein product [Rotaria sp. Silwood1]|nr:unnamed protein product [Rotaria sp. Silwood1]